MKITTLKHTMIGDIIHTENGKIWEVSGIGKGAHQIYPPLPKERKGPSPRIQFCDYDGFLAHTYIYGKRSLTRNKSYDIVRIERDGEVIYKGHDYIKGEDLVDVLKGNMYQTSIIDVLENLQVKDVNINNLPYGYPIFEVYWNSQEDEWSVRQANWSRDFNEHTQKLKLNLIYLTLEEAQAYTKKVNF